MPNATIQDHIDNVKLSVRSLAEVAKHLHQMREHSEQPPELVAQKLQTAVEATRNGFDAIVSALDVLADSLHQHF